MGALESSFDVMGCTDLLRWLKSADKTGVLRVSHQAAVRRIYVADGEIVACSTNEPRLQLAPYLRAHGWIDDAALHECVERHDNAGPGLGTLLVEWGKISEIDLQSTVLTRAEEVILGLFDWPQGLFRFEADQKPPDGVLKIRMSVDAALSAGAERQDEWDQIRNVFHSPHLAVQKRKGAVEPPTVVNHLENKLHESIDGRRTLADIARLCGSSEYLAGSFLLRQVELGHLQLKSVPGAKTGVVDGGTALNELRELLATKEYEAAVEWIDRHELTPGKDEFLTMLIARAEAGFLATAYRTEVPPDAVPRRIRPDEPPGREAELLSSDDVLLLDLIDGSWDVRSLGWIAPLRKIDVVRGLMRLRKHGCIELRSQRRQPSLPRHAGTPGGPSAGAEGAIADIERAVGELGD